MLYCTPKAIFRSCTCLQCFQNICSLTEGSGSVCVFLDSRAGSVLLTLAAPQTLSQTQASEPNTGLELH